MRKFAKILAMFVVVCMLLTLAIGCGKSKEGTEDTTETTTTVEQTTPEPEKPPLNIRAVHRWNPNPASYAKDTTLADYFHQKVKEAVGREVNVEWITRPNDIPDFLQYYQMLVSANDVPELVVQDDLYFFADAYDYAIESGMFREMPLENFKKYMPRYLARIQEYGLSFDNDIFEANKWKGKAYSIPWEFGSAIWPDPNKLLPENFGSKQAYNYYYLAFRDDILKQIFPNARSEAEQKALLAQKGKLTIEDITGDIPINSMETMTDYLRKVKALNVKVGDKPVIPGALCSSSASPASLQWSLQTIMGYGWRWPLIWTDPLENSFFLRASDIFKEYMRWWNNLYNEGLLDPEIFVMKDDQYQAKMINGEYAVFNGWGPVAAARDVGKERGYGYRYLPAFHPIDMNHISNKYVGIGYTAGTMFITSTVKDEDLADVLGYIDYVLSEEADEIAYWGHPDWYTGTGKDRRYKPEYKDIENWAIYGTKGEKDGRYYGLAGSANVIEAEGVGIQHAIKPFAFFNPTWTYPEGPEFTIPKDPATVAELTDLFTYSDKVMTQEYIVANQVRYKEIGWSWTDLMNIKEWTDYDAKLTARSEESKANFIKLVVDKPSNFDKNWEKFVGLMEECGVREAEQASRELLKNLWKEKIEPNIIK